MEKLKNNKGITLVMLVVTIIILLILAGISISAITGGESSMEKAKKAKDETAIKAEMEELQKIINQSAAKGIRHGNFSGSADSQTIRDALKKNKLIEENPDDVIIDGRGRWEVTGIKTGQKYTIESDGSVNKYTLLPFYLQQVEYIESTGTQYIDTKVKSNSRINISAIASPSSTNCEALFGARTGAGSKDIRIIFSSNNYISVGLWNTYWGWAQHISTDTYMGKHKFEIRENGFYFDDVLQYQNYLRILDGEGYNNMFIFATNNSSTVISYGSWKLYNLKIDNVRNFIPCYSTSTVTNVNGKQCLRGTNGLYDTVEGKFYTNEGTGTFLKGEDVL